MRQDEIIDIGPECFADGDAEVISYKGANYYLACDAFVSDIPGGGAATHCVKRINHPGYIHEDFDGRTREETKFEILSDLIYENLPWEGETYQAVAENLAGVIIEEGWKLK